MPEMKLVKAPTVPWTDVDKFRFYSIGTGMYTFLTILLHPISVMKTRQQILNEATKSNSNLTNSPLRIFYRGLPIVLFIAVPARALYVTILEESRIFVHDTLTRISMSKIHMAKNTQTNHENDKRQLHLVSIFPNLSATTITTLSGGIAGGIAGMSAQICLVPMDVISQKQMVAETHIPVTTIIKDVLQSHDGWRGFYKGFGVSIFSALPTGMLWWATYGGMQLRLSQLIHSSTILSNTKVAYAHPGEDTHNDDLDWKGLMQRGIIQVGSGFSAAVVAASMTQPLDVIKTRLQVMGGSNMVNKTAFGDGVTGGTSFITIAKDLAKQEGMGGFFRGTGPRIMSIGIWGTVLSSAYEYLKFISRFEFDTDQRMLF